MPVGIVRSVTAMRARAEPILDRLPIGRCRMVEVGVSTATLAQHLLEARPDLMWHGVDPWCGREGFDAAYRATNDAHARLDQATAEHHMRLAESRVRRFGSRARLYRMRGVEAAPLFEDGSLDLVFLDGDHSLSGVLDDCRAWWGKIMSGGWLGGHDYGNRDPRFAFGVDEAVQMFSGEVGVPFDLSGGLCWWMRKP